MSFFRYSAESSENVRKKIKIYVILVVVSFVCLWMRVWYLQILKGEDFMGRSEENRIRKVSLPAYRGTIKDRNGETLVNVRPSFNLYVTPEDAKDLPNSLAFLSAKFEIDGDKLKEDISQSRPFKNVLIKRDISRQEVAYVEENKMRLPGIHIKVEPLRSYVYKDLAAHILGYLGEVSKEKLKNSAYSKYALGDMIGRNGLEDIYEFNLKGEKGFKEVEVDVSGRELKTLRKLPPESGDSLVLTLDVRVQKKLEEWMDEISKEDPVEGSVVVMKVQTGEIIAMVSKPSFDPNLFAAGISRTKWNGLLRDGKHPLQNRAIDGQYPPGSTYKLVTAYAALAENLIDPESTIFCPGHFRLGRGRYRCWKKRGHGAVNLHDALVQSCDVYFYTLGYRLGVDNLAKYAKKLGLGARTGVRLNGEKPGLVPSIQWKKKARNKPWLPGETISASIGQGYNLVTPLQNASMVSTVANGGLLVKPYLVKKTEDSEGKVIQEFFPEIVRNVEFDPEILKHLKEGLRGVVNEPRGTGRRARLKNIVVSGKTGTAQVVRMKDSDKINPEDETPYLFRDHAWFVAFAPYEKPEVAVSVIIEHGGHGGATAAPIARKVLESYFTHYPPAKYDESG
ncbi:MAG: penicillin-binding protein 2 [Nitrospinaceae bacterium]|jgi:penicillin-binding protein 2|nr:penicillin-binding protein 2 [Nitrospinaceae bacterium]|tara:strand:+ start:2033 stop:3895 length:1863 start_codon:yes stop_codon:yes gene_type:complete